MSANNVLEVDVLSMVAEGVDPAWRTATNAWLALFTSDPTETGSLANECADSTYARLQITRAAFWAGSNPLTNSIQALWPTLSDTLPNLTHWALVSSASGASAYVFSGSLINIIPNLPGISPLAQIGVLQLSAD